MTRAKLNAKWVVYSQSSSIRDLTFLGKAALFRVYAFDSSGKVLKELKSSDGYELHWTVEVANKKAAWYKFEGKISTVLRSR